MSDRRKHVNQICEAVLVIIVDTVHGMVLHELLHEFGPNAELKLFVIIVEYCAGHNHEPLIVD